jgi:hexulose-6-phosphate isomerase
LKIAINAWSFPSNVTIPQGLRLAKRAGFDAVELNISEDGYLRPGMSDDEIGGLRTAAENMSLELSSVCTGLWWKYPLTSPDPQIVDTAMEIARHGLKMAKVLGAGTLLIVPGIVTEDVPYEVAYERAQSALKRLAKDAEREGVSIGLENVGSKFLLSPLEMRDFIDSIESPYVKAYFDIGNVVLNGYPEQWIRILGERIVNVHAKDYCAAAGNYGSANVLTGDVNWIGVRNALREIGYDGAITAEIPGYTTLADLGIRHAGESLKRIFKGTATKRGAEDAEE